MKKLTFYLLVMLLVSSCGESVKEEKESAKDTTIAEIPVDTTTVADTVSEKICEVHVECMWDKKNKDIPKGYMKKVNNLVNCSPINTEISTEEAMDYTWDYLNVSQLKKLNTYELIYYCIAYPGSFSQVCAMDEFYDTTNTPKIVSFFSDNYSAYDLSNLQREMLKINRDSIILVLNKLILKTPKKTKSDYLIMLKNIEAVESIPTVIKTCSATNLIGYTYLIKILKIKEYSDFKSTDIYNTLYSDDSYTYGGRIEANAENRKILTDLALKMYKEQ